jgi:hypothetical protein
MRDVAQADRRIAAKGDRNGGVIGEARQVASRTHHDLGLTERQHRTAGCLVRALQRCDHLVVRDCEGRHPDRVEHHLILRSRAADRRDFRSVRHGRKLQPQPPVLQRTQLADVVSARRVEERVLIDSADTRRVWSDHRPCGRGQAFARLRQCLLHPRAGPVQVRVVVEQYVDETVAEEGVATRRRGARH